MTSHSLGLISLIGALSLGIAAILLQPTTPATPPGPKATDLVAIILWDNEADRIAEIAFVREGTTYACPPEYECITAGYDGLRNKSLDTINSDVRELARKAHPIAPKIDG